LLNFNVNDIFTPQTVEFFKWVTTFHIKNKACKSYEGCDFEFSKSIVLTDFSRYSPATGSISSLFHQSYEFLNKSYVFNSKTTPRILGMLINIFINNNFNISYLLDNYTEEDLNSSYRPDLSDVKNTTKLVNVPEEPNDL
jgi:hypothetical protein